MITTLEPSDTTFISRILYIYTIYIQYVQVLIQLLTIYFISCDIPLFFCPSHLFVDSEWSVPPASGGQGWGLVEAMQKSAKWNIPLAVGIGATYSLYTQLPTMHKSTFYWWVSWKQLIWKIWARNVGSGL